MEQFDRLYIKFRYKDRFTHGRWVEQECVCSSVSECKKIYGLGVDCDYEIVAVEPYDEPIRK